MISKALIAGLMAGCVTLPASANSVPASDLITAELIQEVKDFLEVPIIEEAIISQNRKRLGITEAEILKLDAAWMEEVRDPENQPMITAALGGPASSYLLRQQAGSKGLYSEIFVMDEVGLNVAQSSITSDYWQGDEAKFQKTYPQGAGVVFVDEPEFLADYGIWIVQVNLTLSSKGQPIGASTVEINLTELERRVQAGVN